MTLRQTKREVQSGHLAISLGEVQAPTEAKRRRLTAAVSAARVYLESKMGVVEMSSGLGVTSERVAQVVRLGISYMREQGWLREAQPPVNTPSVCDRGRG